MPPTPMIGSPIIAAMLPGPISAIRSSSSRIRKSHGSSPPYSSSGKFHGTTVPTTPSGARRTTARLPGAVGATSS